MVSTIQSEEERMILLKGIRYHPINVLYIIVNKQQENEDFNNNLYEGLQKFFDIPKFYKININQFEDCIKTIKEIFITELSYKNLSKIYINVSTGSRVMAIISTFFAVNYPRKVQLFYIHPDYQLEELPFFPLKNLTEYQIEILEILNKYNKFSSTTEVLEKMNEIEGHSIYKNKHKTFHCLEYLSKMGLVEISIKKNKKEYSLTDMGKFYGRMFLTIEV